MKLTQQLKNCENFHQSFYLTIFTDTKKNKQTQINQQKTTVKLTQQLKNCENFHQSFYLTIFTDTGNHFQ